MPKPKGRKPKRAYPLVDHPAGDYQLSVAVTLPPSVNSIWSRGRYGQFLSPGYRQWRQSNLKSISPDISFRLHDDIRVTIQIYPGKGFKSNSDIDNRAKGILDLLVLAGLIEDDSAKHLVELKVNLMSRDFKSKSLAHAEVLVQGYSKGYKKGSDVIQPNPTKPRRIRRQKNPIWNDIFYLDSTSPSGLRWKIKPSVAINISNVAGHLTASTGYWSVKYKRKPYHLHRVVWELHHGPIPKGMVVDHIDCDKKNNSITNLRLASSSDNSCNRRLSSRNTTGVKGLSVDTVRGYKYYVTDIFKCGKRVKTTFPYTDKGREAAIEWLKITRETLHGEFANNGEPHGL